MPLLGSLQRLSSVHFVQTEVAGLKERPFKDQHLWGANARLMD